MTARGGGLACNACVDLHAARGSSNPGLHFLSNWSINLKKCERHTRDALTESDIDDAECFMHSSDISLTERGMVLKEKASAQGNYVQRMRKLTKILPMGSIKVVTPRSVSSPKYFFLIAHELYLKNPTFSKSILTSLMENMVTQITNPTKSPKIEACTMNFFCHIATVSPQAAELVGANLGSTPSKRWMQALNARERVACVYECQLSEMQNQMSDAINKRLVAKQTTSTTSFSIAINATKVSQLLEISTTFKAIMGGVHPHHMISTIDLDLPTIKNILDCREYLDEVIDIASEVKVTFVVFQKPPPGVSPIVIISAWLQSNNECSLQTS
jgi:hypothetical protein